MAHNTDELKAARENLEWLYIPEKSFKEKANSKGLYAYLVPVGCGVTVGVLAVGLLNMRRRNSRKQQICMRYRVLSQGITIAIALCAMFQAKK